MKNCSRIPATLLWLVLALALPVQAATEVVVEESIVEAAEPEDMEEKVLSVPKGMSDVLAAATDFDYQIETVFDVVQRSGVKVEFAASRKIQVSRPNLIRMEGQRRDGIRTDAGALA